MAAKHREVWERTHAGYMYLFLLWRLPLGLGVKEPGEVDGRVSGFQGRCQNPFTDSLRRGSMRDCEREESQDCAACASCAFASFVALASLDHRRNGTRDCRDPESLILLQDPIRRKRNDQSGCRSRRKWDRTRACMLLFLCGAYHLGSVVWKPEDEDGDCRFRGFDAGDLTDGK